MQCIICMGQFLVALARSLWTLASQCSLRLPPGPQGPGVHGSYAVSGVEAAIARTPPGSSAPVYTPKALPCLFDGELCCPNCEYTVQLKWLSLALCLLLLCRGRWVDDVDDVVVFVQHTFVQKDPLI